MTKKSQINESIKLRGVDDHRVMTVRLKESTITEIESLIPQADCSRNSLINILLDESLKASKKVRQSGVSRQRIITVRLKESIIADIESLVPHADCSRNKLINILLDEGLERKRQNQVTL